MYNRHPLQLETLSKRQMFLRLSGHETQKTKADAGILRGFPRPFQGAVLGAEGSESLNRPGTRVGQLVYESNSYPFHVQCFQFIEP